mmetsp:Transcript_1311/g.3203  ORF Transcript_1311/g.3203 Transcript_1311/m.3203 type:complete len:273 (-) Transcript_1311:1106-1924(-)
MATGNIIRVSDGNYTRALRGTKSIEYRDTEHAAEEVQNFTSNRCGSHSDDTSAVEAKLLLDCFKDETVKDLIREGLRLFARGRLRFVTTEFHLGILVRLGAEHLFEKPLLESTSVVYILVTATGNLTKNTSSAQILYLVFQGPTKQPILDVSIFHERIELIACRHSMECLKLGLENVLEDDLLRTAGFANLGPDGVMHFVQEARHSRKDSRAKFLKVSKNVLWASAVKTDRCTTIKHCVGQNTLKDVSKRKVRKVDIGRVNVKAKVAQTSDS